MGGTHVAYASRLARSLAGFALLARAGALDAKWTPGPNDDARGNSFSSRRRFAGMKDGERLPDYYTPDAEEAQSSTLMMLVSASVLFALVVGVGWWLRGQVRQILASTPAALADAELVRQARLAKFAGGPKGD